MLDKYFPKVQCGGFFLFASAWTGIENFYLFIFVFVLACSFVFGCFLKVQLRYCVFVCLYFDVSLHAMLFQTLSTHCAYFYVLVH